MIDNLYRPHRGSIDLPTYTDRIAARVIARRTPAMPRACMITRLTPAIVTERPIDRPQVGSQAQI